MAVFMGANSVALGIALLIQAMVIPLALIIFVIYSWRTASHCNNDSLFSVFRRHIPGWLWFAYWSVNSLVIAGEAAFAITVSVSETRPKLLEHAPLLCAFSCTSAYLAIYVFMKIQQQRVTT